MVAACAAPSPASVSNHVASAVPVIRLGPSSRDCRASGAFRPELGDRIRAFVAAELVERPARIVRELVVDQPSELLLQEAAVDLDVNRVAVVVEPRDTTGMLWLVHASFQAIYCIRVAGDEVVLAPTMTRITRALE